MSAPYHPVSINSPHQTGGLDHKPFNPVHARNEWDEWGGLFTR